MLANNNLQIGEVTKADEGVYRCEASVEARGEIDFVDIAVVVNGESPRLLTGVTEGAAFCSPTQRGRGDVPQLFILCVWLSREQWIDFMARRLMSSL